MNATTTNGNGNGGNGRHGAAGLFTQPTPAGAARTMAQVLGEIVWLMSQSPLHKQMFIADLEWMVMTPALLGQFRLYYDTGDATDCGVTGLEADGGNNDAAALFHVANVAAASRRRAKVVVMISDGLPTECSVEAVRGLVTTLTRRRGIVCAQVAVRRLEEEMFPHYLVLDDEHEDIAVARFGRMIGDLARRVLAS